MSSNLRVLVAGCGSAGSRHARNMAAQGVENIRLFDPDRQRAERLAKEIGARTYESVDSALDKGCDAVVVATPPLDHLSTSLKAVEVGAHLLIEKPLSTSTDGVAELLEKAEDANLVLMVAYNLRFLPALMRVKDLVESGAIGRLLTVHAEFGQYLPTWRPTSDYRKNYITSGDEGGGIILEESHEFDYVRWLAGEVTSVYCAAGKLSDLEMQSEDSAVVTMRHEGNTISSLSIDCTQRGYRRAARLVGTEATINWDFNTGTEIIDNGNQRSFEPLVSDLGPTYVDEMRVFLESVAGEATPPVNGRDAHRVLEITLAAKRSASEGIEIAL